MLRLHKMRAFLTMLGVIIGVMSVTIIVMISSGFTYYMTTEFNFIKIADRYTTSSSMMPQKRNPDMLELIRGRCGNVYGDLFALMTILKGLPIGYNRDLQEDKRIVFRAYDTVTSCLTMAAAISPAANSRSNVVPVSLDMTLGGA